MSETGLVQERILTYEKMAVANDCFVREAPVPTKLIKELIRFFEAAMPNETLDAVPKDHLFITNAKKADIIEATPSSDSSSFETSPSRFQDSEEEYQICEDDLAGPLNGNKLQLSSQESSVKKLISFFETNGKEEIATGVSAVEVQDIDTRFSYPESSCESSPSQSVGGKDEETVCDNGLADSLQRNEEDEKSSEIEIYPNTDPSTSQADSNEIKENPFIFHVNAPATNISEAQKNAKRRGRKKKSHVRKMIMRGLSGLKKSQRKMEKETTKEEATGDHKQAQNGKNVYEWFHSAGKVGKQKMSSFVSKVNYYFPRRRKNRGTNEETASSLQQTKPREEGQTYSLGNSEEIVPVTTIMTVGNIRLTISATAKPEEECLK